MLKFKVVCVSCDRFEWFDAVEWCGRFHCECGDPDYVATDYEGNIWGMDLGELSEEFISADSKAEREQFLRYVDYFGDGSTLDRMRETYMGWYKSPGEFAAQILQDEAGTLPSWAQYNIDWDGVAYDYLRHDVEFVEHNFGVEVYGY